MVDKSAIWKRGRKLWKNLEILQNTSSLHTIPCTKCVSTRWKKKTLFCSQGRNSVAPFIAIFPSISQSLRGIAKQWQINSSPSLKRFWQWFMRIGEIDEKSRNFPSTQLHQLRESTWSTLGKPRTQPIIRRLRRATRLCDTVPTATASITQGNVLRVYTMLWRST